MKERPIDSGYGRKDWLPCHVVDSRSSRKIKEESAMVNVKSPSLRGYLVNYGNIQTIFQFIHGSVNILLDFHSNFCF